MIYLLKKTAWLWAGTFAVTICSVVGAVVADACWPGFRLTHLPLHALIVGAGGLIALAIAGILLIEIKQGTKSSHELWLASGFISMGVFDLFLAATMPGPAFVWLHSLATCTGGPFFALVWLTPPKSPRFRELRFPLFVAVVAVATAVSVLAFESSLPILWTSENHFSILARVLNVGGGIGFLVSAVFFFSRFRRFSRLRDWMFGIQATLFGMAGVLFVSASLWDSGWWWWHILRLTAYIAALAYGLKVFHDTQSELRIVNRRLGRANTVLDQTVERRTAELREIEERFELAVRGSTDGLWDWNLLTNEVYYSPRMKELLGYRDDEFPNVFESFESRLHPDDHARTMAAIDRQLTDREPYDVLYRLRTKSGEFRWFRARGLAVWNDQGQPHRMAGSITDVTEEHRLRERFRLAVEASPTALLLVDRHGRVKLANSQALALFDYTEEQLLDRSIATLLPGTAMSVDTETGLGPLGELTTAVRGPVEAIAGARGLRRDGTEFPIEVRSSPVQTEDGAAIIYGVTDITDRLKTMRAMEQAREAAESANRAKSSFLANMSHEIRTPMNGILGMTQLLAQTELNPHQRDYLTTVEESAHILLRLLNDILDFSKIEAGKLELEQVDFRLSECVTRAAQMLRLRAADKGLEIACRIAPEIPDHLRGDPGRLQQILVNLLSNAVKFTMAGEILINVDAQSITSDSVTLRVAVHDDGIGIATDKQKSIFESFEQAETSTTRRFGGTGLGLSISRQLVEMMGGEIGVDSEPGRGATFHFTADFAISRTQLSTSVRKVEELQGLRVLVIDDHVTNRQILSELLTFWQMRPVAVASAAAARAALTQAIAEADAADQAPFDLILLDHHMPGEDGFQFAQWLTELPAAMRGGHRYPIIMLSSGTAPVDPDLCETNGICRFMAKPVIASELLDTILRLFGHPADHEAVTEREDRSPPARRRVLLAEDNEINRLVALGFLRRNGHQVVVVGDGQQAYDALVDQRFDVVLMDMQMPVMDGYEATAAIRRREHQVGGHVPIVAMTAEALQGDRERCLAAGMDDYLAKPLSQAELDRVIERFPATCLDQATVDSHSTVGGDVNTESFTTAGDTVANRAGGSDTDVDSAGVTLRHDRPPATESPAIDWDIALRHIPGGEENIRQLTPVFRGEIDSLLDEIRQAAEAGDSQVLRRCAHTMKGTAACFGATGLVQAASALETLASGPSPNGRAAALSAIENEWARVQAGLDDFLSQSPES